MFHNIFPNPLLNNLMLSDPLHRASAYPYKLTGCSYVMDNGEYRLVENAADWPSLEGRRAVLAVGSNMSPQQLARKFPGPVDGVIPVSRIRLHDFDTVYSTHFSNYGAIPATLFPSPGTVVSLCLNWLTPRQEEEMHKSEVAGEHYQFCELAGLTLENDHGPSRLESVHVYLSSGGALPVDGQPVPMREAAALNRRWAPKGQKEIQDHARSLFAKDLSVDEFIYENIQHEDKRLRRTDALRKTALTFDYDCTVHLS